MSSAAGGAFWDWSLRQYEAEGVAPLLLHLQNDYDLSVNILLWCAWCARGFDDIPEETLAAAVELAARWTDEVSKPLRKARRALKTPPSYAEAAAASQLRGEVKAAELAAERIEQLALERLALERLKPSSDGAGAEARLNHNLAAYAKRACADPRGEDFATLLQKLAIHLRRDEPAGIRDGAAHE